MTFYHGRLNHLIVVFFGRVKDDKYGLAEELMRCHEMHESWFEQNASFRRMHLTQPPIADLLPFRVSIFDHGDEIYYEDKQSDVSRKTVGDMLACMDADLSEIWGCRGESYNIEFLTVCL